MRCGKSGCDSEITHALLIVERDMAVLEVYARCEKHGRDDVKFKLVQKVHPNAKTKLVRL